MIRGKRFVTERAVGPISILSGDYFWTSSLTLVSRAHYRVSRLFPALHSDVTKMFGVTDRTSGSSQFCVEVTDVDCNKISVTINYVFVVG